LELFALIGHYSNKKTRQAWMNYPRDDAQELFESLEPKKIQLSHF
jgi:hypothetical protein